MTEPTPPPLGRISGRGWAYAGAILGGAVSIAANVAHSYVPPEHASAGWSPHGGAVIGAVFWPVALFVAIEILARTAWPTGRQWLTIRLVGLLPVALVAAVVSYRHLSGLLAFYREDGLTATIGPLAVDGLMVMATGALIAAARRRATTTEATAPDATGAPDTRADTAPDIDASTAPITAPGDGPDASRTSTRTPRRTSRPNTGKAVARLRDRHPDLSPAEIAKRLGVSDRTVRRHLASLSMPDSKPGETTLNAAPLTAA